MNYSVDWDGPGEAPEEQGYTDQDMINAKDVVANYVSCQKWEVLLQDIASALCSERASLEVGITELHGIIAKQALEINRLECKAKDREERISGLKGRLEEALRRDDDRQK